MVLYNWIFLIFLLSHQLLVGEGKIINTCTNHSPNSSLVYCGPGHSHTLVVIHCIFAEENMKKYLVEKCNGRHSCRVPLHNDWCVQGVYGCSEVINTLQLTESPSYQLIATQPWFGLRSEGYLEGKSQDAENVHCVLRSLHHIQGQWLGVQFDIYELAPFAESTEYCLTASEVMGPIACSASKKTFDFARFWKTRNTSEGWHFNLTLAPTASRVPKVRFWMAIRVWPAGGDNFQLECKSEPVKFGVCGGELTDVTGIIGFPLKPDSSPESRECEWNITLEESKTVSLLFTYFDLKSCVNCTCGDNIKIYDGRSKTAKLLGTYCGNSLPDLVNSTGNSLRIVFKTDGASGISSFKAAYYPTVPSGPFLGNVSKDNGANFNLFIPIAAGFGFLCLLLASAFSWAMCTRRRPRIQRKGLQPIPKMEPIQPIIDWKEHSDYYEISDYAPLSDPHRVSEYLEPVVHYQSLTPSSSDPKMLNAYNEFNGNNLTTDSRQNQNEQREPRIERKSTGLHQPLWLDQPLEHKRNSSQPSIVAHEYLQVFPNAQKPTLGNIAEANA